MPEMRLCRFQGRSRPALGRGEGLSHTRRNQTNQSMPALRQKNPNSRGFGEGNFVDFSKKGIPVYLFFENGGFWY
jgi:hypothetical protein